MKVFHHLMYEYQKGLRDLCLYTCSKILLDKIEKRLSNFNIEYKVYEVSENKINVFFGGKDCIEIVKDFSSKNLNLLTAEEDFILGIMLGYCKQQQYERLLKRKYSCE